MGNQGGLRKISRKLKKFVKDRDWEQYHSPKNLSMALAVETSELMEHFQWLTENQSKNLSKADLKKVKDEIGDVLVYLTELCDMLGVDPIRCAHDKIKKNARKYPVKLAKGSAKKYTDL
jgi:NTP pyrophosphatase (non-canonical NTP hydrolase)